MTDRGTQRYEVIPNRLYFVALREAPRQVLISIDRSITWSALTLLENVNQSKRAFYFTTDNTLQYWNFFLDFGPLSLGQIYRCCQKLNRILSSPEHEQKKIYYYSSTHSHKRTNAVMNICTWSMLYLGKTPEEAFKPFKCTYPPFPFFHDASPCVCTYNLSILDCLRGTYRAHSLGFFNFDKFDVEEYEKYEKVEYGDLNWLREGKWLAFAAPCDKRTTHHEMYVTLTPEDYVGYFKKRYVGLIVRLNKAYYDKTRFTKRGFRHRDLYYLDGSVPSEAIILKFLKWCEDEPAGIAVHCKAGLGRTGTCIGCYFMKHYGFTAAEFIGWVRVCRPGSVIGPQQHYLREMQDIMWQEGEAWRKARGLKCVEEFLRWEKKRARQGLDNVSDGMSTMKIGSSATSRTHGEDSTGGRDDYTFDTNRYAQDKSSSISTEAASQGDRLRAKHSPKNRSSRTAQYNRKGAR